MRSFFALDIDPATQCSIETWRSRMIRPMGRAVPAANFHITLNFLGEITPQQLHRLCVEADRIKAAKIELRLDKPEYFPASGLLWLAASEVPAVLMDLVKALRKVSKKSGIQTSRKSFRPHLTLFRNYHTRPALLGLEPGFSISCDGFVLFQSVMGRKEVRYEAVRRWTP